MNKKYIYNIISKITPLTIDIAIVYIAFNFAYYIRFFNNYFISVFPVTKGVPLYGTYNHILMGVCFAWMIIFVFSGMYDKNYISGFDDFVHIFKAVSLATILTITVTFLYREFEYSRIVIMIAWFLCIVIINIAHSIMKWANNYILHKLFGPKRILVMGSGKSIDVFRRYFDRTNMYKAYYLNNMIASDELTKLVKEKKIGEIIITGLKVKHEDLSEISNICDDHGVDFRIVPDIIDLRMGELIIDDSFGLPLLRIKPISLYGVNRVMKRIFDVFFSIVFLGFFILPLSIIAILIKLESEGPVFYIRKRVGYKGVMFLFYKFRSMVKNADVLLENLKKLSERDGPVFKMRGDPRITYMGRILRKLSLDELPQVLNVLKGDMSIIGPRPQVIWEAEAYDEYAMKRLNVLPGITGLWQVSGRAKLSYEDMIKLDIFYIEHWSLGLDLKIILKTIPTVLIGEGAY